MNLKTLGLFTLIGSSLLSASSVADTVTMKKAIPFAKGTYVRQAIKSQCNLQTKLPHFVKAFARRQGLKILFNNNLASAGGKVLHVKFTRSSNSGGGAWSGSKMLSVTGSLRQGKRVIAKFTATRFTGGGYWGAYKGTCSLLGRNAKAIGRDIAHWLLNPTDGAHLGDGF